MNAITAGLSDLAKEIFSISYNLFKLMIPIIIVVKFIDELGGIDYIGNALAPVMQLVGLPASYGFGLGNHNDYQYLRGHDHIYNLVR